MLKAKYLDKKLYILFIVKLFSTLSFSVMFSSLALYLTSVTKIQAQSASEIVGVYIALNYVLPIVGGFIGSRFVNFKLLFCSGLIVQSLGLFILSYKQLIFPDAALSLVLVGSMVNSVSIIIFVNEICGVDNHKRRIAMLFNYMALNIGFFIGYLFAGFAGSIYQNYTFLFKILCVFPLLSALLMSFFSYKSKLAVKFIIQIITLFILFTLVFFIIWLILRYATSAREYLFYIACIGLIYLFYEAIVVKNYYDKVKIFSFLFYAIISIAFWSIYMTIPTMMMNFIDKNFNLYISSHYIAPQWLNIIDPAVLIIGTPVLVLLTKYLKKSYNIYIPTAVIFFMGLLSITIANLYLSHESARLIAEKMSLYSAVIFMLFVSIGELFVGPEGYTLTGKLLPDGLRGTGTGVWLSTVGISSLISTYLSDMVLNQSITSPIKNYAHSFNKIGVYMCIVTGITLLVGLIFDFKIKAKFNTSEC